MPPAERREYAGNAPPTTLSSGIDNATLTIPITNGTGWPTGVIGPFFAVIDKGLSTEEKVKVASRTANVLTVIAGGRGQDGTAAATHASGAAIEHVLTADDLNVMNQHIADPTLDHHTQYYNLARHSALVHGTAMLDVAALTAIITPPAMMAPYAGAAAPSGWLLCNGAAVSRATYAALYAALGGASSPYGQGDGTTTFNVPDTRGRALMGAGTGTGLTARVLGAAIGTESFTIAVANMPNHRHQVNNHDHGATVAAESQQHTHDLASHVHWVNGVGNHQHGIGGDTGNRYLITHGGGVDRAGVAAGGTQNLYTFSGMDAAGGHDHGNTGGPSNNTSGGRSATHNHGITADAPFTTYQGSDTAISYMTPHLVVNHIIKT